MRQDKQFSRYLFYHNQTGYAVGMLKRVWFWWSRRVLPPRFRFPEGHPDTLSTPKLWHQKPQKSGLMLPCLIRVIPILDIPAAPLVMHVHDLIHFLQGRLFAFRADRERVVGVMLETLELA
jgi:hypothetical protein